MRPELLAADEATAAAAAVAERWIERYRKTASETISTPALDELLRDALGAVARLLDADAVSLLLANEDGTALISRAAYGLELEVDLEVSIPRGAGASGPVLETGRAHFIEDLARVAVVSDVLRMSGLRSYLGVPLASGGRVLGVMHATRRRVAPFEAGDAELLRRFAEPLAAAIERVRIFDAEREARRAAEEATALARRATERLLGLQRITAALAGAPSVGEICAIVIDHAAPDLDDEGERAIWMLRDGRLELVAGRGHSAEYPEIPLDGSLPGAAVLESATPLFIESRAELAGRWPALADGATVSFAALPLVVEGRRIGLMAIGFRHEHAFAPDERGYLVAIAEQAAIALARAESQAALVESRRVAEDRREQLDYLAEASERLSHSLDLDVTLKAVAELAVPRLTDRCALYMVEEGQRIERRVIAPRLNDDEWRLFTGGELALDSPQGIGAIIRTGRPQYLRDTTDAMLAAAAPSPEALTLMRRVGFGGILGLPLRSRGRTIGALAFFNRAGRPMEPETVTLAEELTARAAVAIDNARMFSERSHVARRLVESLLPAKLPEMPGLDLAVHYRPARAGLEVGGDFYDVIAMGPDACVVVVGDVQGKGVEAAALTGFARNTIKAAARYETSPAAMLAHLNASMIEHIVERAPDPAHPWDSARLCTAVVLRLERRPSGWRALAASAGHPLPLLGHRDGGVEPVGRPALLLGVDPEARYEDSAIDLEPGATLVCFTDGVSDCEVEGDPFGAEGVASVLRSASGTAGETTEAVAAAIAQGATNDDIVVLSIGVGPP